ncbi:MAG: DUF1736 domain-containing protein [Candidatus Paceibacterota bacterium]
MSGPEFYKNKWWVLLSFSVLILVIYGHTLGGGFVYDDRGILENSAMLQNTENLEQILLHPYWNPESGLYRPVTLLSYSLNFTIFGQSPAYFHFVNILLYVVISFLIYLLVKNLFRNGILAFSTAILFLFWPIHTEVVANISGRSELLALFFSLLVLLQFVKDKPNFWLAGLWMLFAVGSKETAVATLPISLLVLYIKNSSLNLSTLKKHFRLVSAVLISACFYFFLRFYALSYNFGLENFFGVKTTSIENPLMFTDVLSRVSTAFGVLWIYFTKLFWPVQLCSDYSYNQIPIVPSFWNMGSLFGLFLFMVSVWLLIHYLKTRPVLSLGAGIFLFSFIPVSNIFFPTGTIAGERLFFFPSLGFALIISYLIYKLYLKIKKPHLKILLISLMAAVLIGYGLISIKRSWMWNNEERLFLSAVKCAPQSVLSRSNAGAMHLLRGDLAKAQEELEIAMSIKPIYSKGINNLGLVYFRLGQNEKARKLYLEALRQEFPYFGAAENLVLLYLTENKPEMARHWLRYLYPGNENLIKNFIDNYYSK